MKILIVKYLPSGEKSKTLMLLEHFKTLVGKHTVEEIDLIKTPPMFHNTWSLDAYKQRNFKGLEITPAMAATIKPMDKLTEQFVASDLIVLVTPMHNFSLPGIVKVYFDAIMQSKLTFKREGDKTVGLMSKKKFLTLYTSMGSYMGTWGYMDNLKTLVKIEIEFMGFKDFEFVSATTGNKDLIDFQITKAKESITSIAQKWSI